MPRAATVPRGTLETQVDEMLVHSIILRRAGTNKTAQSMYLDFTPAGAEVLGAGVTGGVAGVAVYCKDDADIAKGDVFAHGGVQYTVDYLTPIGTHLVGGNAYRIAWARGKQ